MPRPALPVPRGERAAPLRELPQPAEQPVPQPEPQAQPPVEPSARRSAQGSAMQQLRGVTGG